MDCLRNFIGFLKKFQFKSVIEVNEQKRVFQLHRTLMAPWFHRHTNGVVMTFIRLVAFLSVLLIMCITAGFYNPQGRDVSFSLPNDGDAVTWILRFGNITTIICLLYFLVGLFAVGVNKDPKTASESWIFYAMQILWLTAFPLSWLSFVEYYIEVRPNSTLIMGEAYTLTSSFAFMNLDFLVGTQYMSILWSWYSLHMLNLYLTIVMIVSFTGVVVYPTLPWLDHPGTAFFAGLLVNMVLLLICSVISVFSRLRFRIRVQNNESIEGAYEVLKGIPESKNLPVERV